VEQPEILRHEVERTQKLIREFTTYMPYKQKPKEQPIYQKGSKRKRR
jgi:hypothetical protein